MDSEKTVTAEREEGSSDALARSSSLELYEKSKSIGLVCYLVEDLGLTEFHGIKTKTALGIGPCKIEEMKEITDNLTLL